MELRIVQPISVSIKTIDGKEVLVKEPQKPILLYSYNGWWEEVPVVESYNYESLAAKEMHLGQDKK